MKFDRARTISAMHQHRNRQERILRPADWAIAAGAAAFIAAGIIAILPFEARSDRTETAAATSSAEITPGNILASVVDLFKKPDEAGGAIAPTAKKPLETDTAPETTAALAPEAEPLVPADGIRKVVTEDIRIEPVVAETPVQTASLALGTYAFNDRRLPGGCGLMLTRADDENAILFFHELAAAGGDSRGFVLVENEMVAMARVDSSGDPLGFGQYPLQVFESGDGAVKAIVDINLASASEEGSLRLPVERGQLIVTTGDGRTVTMDVGGDAGC